MMRRHPSAANPRLRLRAVAWTAWAARASGTVLLLAATASAHAQGMLRHDLFARPAAVLQPARTALPDGRPDPQAAAPMAAPWAPQLTSVVVAGKDSMAVVNGAVLRLGDVLDGHRLVRVAEREAEFQKDGKPVLIRMRLAARPSTSGPPAAPSEPVPVPPAGPVPGASASAPAALTPPGLAVPGGIPIPAPAISPATKEPS